MSQLNKSQSQNMQDELITISQAAKLLGVHIDTLRKWDKQGKLKSIRVGIKCWRRYKKSDLLKLLNSNNDTAEIN